MISAIGPSMRAICRKLDRCEAYSRGDRRLGTNIAFQRRERAPRRSPNRPAHASRRVAPRAASRRSCPSKLLRPLRRAISPSSAKCGEAGSSAGGMHISPSIVRPYVSRQRARKASASSRQDARLLRLGAGVDLDEQSRALAGLRHRSRAARGDFFAVDRLDHVEGLDRLARLVALQRPDQMKLDGLA